MDNFKNDIKNTIKSFKSISLNEINSIALMKRFDTKYVINITNLNSILKELAHKYKVLEIDGKRIMNYSTLYFDTPAFKFYYDHHNGKSNRVKIRQRKYIDSDLTFLEIKKKNNKGLTNKFRTEINDFETELSDNSEKFISEITNSSNKLAPSLQNNFNRITLVNFKDKERVTIDLNLTYTLNEQKISYSKLVIIELKQERFNRHSLVVKTLKNKDYNSYSISKYCIGIVNLYKDIKYNLFKTKLLKIKKLTA